MITAGDFRKGVTIELDGSVYNIVDFQHVKPGKGAAFVRTRIKNVMTGAVLERTFNPTDKVPRATIETKEMTYLYTDGDFFYFMDVDTYEQIPLGQDIVEDAMHYVKENTNVTKPATLETGYTLNVPIFINQGEKIRIDTRTGEYMERA